MASSNSFAADLAAYLRTRVLTRRVLLLVLLVSGAILAGSETVRVPGMPALAALTAWLVVQFRLWDDLADRDWDRLRYPQRLLVRTQHGQSFTGLLFASILLFGATLLLRGQMRELLVYAILVGLLGFLYHTPRGAGLSRPLRVGLVLSKYPLFVFIVGADGLAPRATWVALCLYGLLVAFDWRDDPELRSAAKLPGSVVAWSLGAAIVLAVFLTR
jgi:4-hydroxybenzoate polyprenyltransferase